MFSGCSGNAAGIVEIAEMEQPMVVWDCDSIEWLVDVLGTFHFLREMTETFVGDRKDGEARANYRAKENGLYFYRGHWTCYRDGQLGNSYKLKYQNDGTASFCQIFAAMIYLGVTDDYRLRPGAYRENIEGAMQFLLNYLKKYSNMNEYLCNELKTDDKWKGTNPTGTNYQLKDVTPKRLIAFIIEVQKHAQTFVGCREG